MFRWKKLDELVALLFRGEISMRIAITLIMISLPCCALADEENWRLDIEVDGVKVWTQDKPGSRYKEARGEIVVAAPPQKAFSVIISAEACRQSVHSCVDAYVVSSLKLRQYLQYGE